MADSGGKKGKKKKGKTLNLNAFLSEGGKAPVIVPAPKNWGDEMEDGGGSDWASDTYPSQKMAFDVTKLPTAPKASLDNSYDPSQLPTSPPFTAYIGSLPYEVTEEEIAHFFHGLKLVSIRLPGGVRQKGFGYAEFEDLDSLKKALELNNETIQNRQIKVDIAGHSSHNNMYRESSNQGAMDSYTSGEPDRTNHDWRLKDSGDAPDDRQRPDRYENRYSSREESRYGRDDRGFGRNDGGFGREDRGFGRDDREFGRDDRGFGRDSRGFGRDDRGFERDDRGFGRDDRGFGRDDRGFGREDRGFGRDDRGFGRDDRSFRRDDRGFGRDDRGFGKDDRGFGREDRGFGKDDRGFGKDDRGFGREDRGFGRDDRGFGRDDRGFGRDDRGFGRDDRGFGRDNWGSGRDDRGFGREDRGFGRDFDRRDDRNYSRSNGHDGVDSDSRQNYSKDGPDAEIENWRAGRQTEKDERTTDEIDGAQPNERQEEQRHSESGPRERKKLQLKPRSIPATDEKDVASSAIFGGARPVDTSTKEREIEERLAKQRIENEPKPKAITKERHNSQGSGDGDDNKHHHHHREARKPRTSSKSEGSEEEKMKNSPDKLSNEKEGGVKQRRPKGAGGSAKYEEPKAPVFSKESMYSVLATEDNSDDDDNASEEHE